MLALIPTRRDVFPDLSTWHCWDCGVSGQMPERMCWCCGSTDESVVMGVPMPQPAGFTYEVRTNRYDPEPFGFEAAPPTDYSCPIPLHKPARMEAS